MSKINEDIFQAAPPKQASMRDVPLEYLGIDITKLDLYSDRTKKRLEKRWQCPEHWEEPKFHSGYTCSRKENGEVVTHEMDRSELWREIKIEGETFTINPDLIEEAAEAENKLEYYGEKIPKELLINPNYTRMLNPRFPTYTAVPSEGFEKNFFTILEHTKKSNKYWLGKGVLNGRDYGVVFKPNGNILTLDFLLTPDKIRKKPELMEEIEVNNKAKKMFEVLDKKFESEPDFNFPNEREERIYKAIQTAKEKNLEGIKYVSLERKIKKRIKAKGLSDKNIEVYTGLQEIEEENQLATRERLSEKFSDKDIDYHLKKLRENDLIERVSRGKYKTK